ncbi:phage terminase large subunit family protein [Beijerinckia sp. L45]|uniref:phage terminase large subunit family protein n=1 Tax=Beijerinckia sp. L45 TaxID=1641855 RepID=UPI00131EAABA|nr:phage terminase large subunit family protein [Beijerinckia sp. L45]
MTYKLTKYKNGSTALVAALRKGILEALKPPTHLSLSEWANTYAHLSAETSADAGKFRSFKYQDGIMDAVTDPSVTQITVMKSARVGYTKILDHIVGYHIAHDPSPILVVQPTVADAEDYSRTEIAPMLRDTPCLAAIVGDLKAKDSDQRVAKRMFSNGSSISFIGANSAAGFRRITARVVAFDEVDGYPVGGADDEGDQIALGIKRTETFWNRKIILGSTPTLKGSSRIEKSFLESDQRRYHVPCPQCGHMQVLKWENIRWDKDVDEAGKTTKHYPETAYFVCEDAGCIIQEHDKPKMIDNGEWIAEAPFTGHAGFHIWAAYSLFPNAAWRFLVEEFLRVKHDPTQLQTFCNLVWGQTWEEQGETVSAGNLQARVENHDGDTIPESVKVLTAGVDTQDDRLEVKIVGWGAKEEAWVVATEVLLGDPSQPHVWAQLDAVLTDRYHSADGRTLRIRATCVDSGGHHAAMVYSFCKTRKKQNVYAIKGAAGPKTIWPKRASKGGNKGADTVYIVGVDTAKEAIYSRLRIREPGPGYIHFGADCDDEYFLQLTAEKVVTRYRAGRPFRIWVPIRARNEALDLFVYGLAALKSLGTRLDRLEGMPSETPEPKPIPAPIADEIKPLASLNAPQEVKPSPRYRPQQQQKGFLGGSNRGWLHK